MHFVYNNISIHDKMIFGSEKKPTNVVILKRESKNSKIISLYF